MSAYHAGDKLRLLDSSSINFKRRSLLILNHYIILQRDNDCHSFDALVVTDRYTCARQSKVFQTWEPHSCIGNLYQSGRRLEESFPGVSPQP